ncbi:hypothetical protein OUZ56_026685 [Daphnia magna]|uniref:Uncharacterized protein n=1 Tax=Daphnia magna TaxID=35525 RepID=A0ABQ9ZMG8_9CRUS|nr:hypothetical protein OUZ56_026685 [Daphnia magna]
MSPSSIRERTTSSNIQLTVTTVVVLSQYPSSSGSWLNIHLFSDFIIGLSLHRLDCLIISHSTAVVSMAIVPAMVTGRLDLEIGEVRLRLACCSRMS